MGTPSGNRTIESTKEGGVIDDATLFKIWDGDKSMIYHLIKSVLTEGPDENNVLGKWTRERKQKAEADNAEVRRKKAEAQAQ